MFVGFISFLFSGLLQASAYTDDTIVVNGHSRRYVTFKPASSPTALLIFIHGAILGQICEHKVNGTAQGDLVAQSTGAVVLCPKARLSTSFTSFCWQAFPTGGICRASDSYDPDDDMKFLEDLIVRATAQYSIPAGKVAMGGTSLGGSMVYRFACEKPSLIDLIVPCETTWYDPWLGWSTSTEKQCKPTKPVPLLTMVGDKDSIHAATYMQGWSSLSSSVYGCAGEPLLVAKGKIMDTWDTTCYEYKSCTTQVALNRMCSIINYGHMSLTLVDSLIEAARILNTAVSAPVEPELPAADSTRACVTGASVIGITVSLWLLWIL